MYIRNTQTLELHVQWTRFIFYNFCCYDLLVLQMHSTQFVGIKFMMYFGVHVILFCNVQASFPFYVSLLVMH